MQWVDQTLADFGARMGIANLSFNEQGLATLQFQSGHQLVVESVEEDVLIYQVRPVPFPSAELRMQVLRMADFRHGAPFPYQVAMRGTGNDAMLIVLVRVPSREFTLQLLEQVADALHTRWLELA